MAKYNGHKNWNHWNVSLWINNDENLYKSAVFYANHYRKALIMTDQIKSHVQSIINDLNNGYEGWGTVNEYDEPEDAFKYLDGVLDINWVLNSDRTLKGARLLVAFGGPNIWIDTSKGTVEGVWWGDSYTGTYNTDSEFACELNEALETLYA